MKEKERVESLVDDQVEDGGDADLDQVFSVLLHPRSHLRTRQTLQYQFAKKVFSITVIKIVHVYAHTVRTVSYMKEILCVAFPDPQI